MRILHRQDARRGWLRWPCESCGGVKLPVRDPDERAGLGWVLPRMPVGLDRRCPQCETRRRRLEPAGSDPAVWYDTLLRDWVVRLPCPGLCHGALLPLEIDWFDADWAAVHRAASDLAHMGAELGDFIVATKPRSAESTIHLRLPDD